MRIAPGQFLFINGPPRDMGVLRQNSLVLSESKQPIAVQNGTCSITLDVSVDDSGRTATHPFAQSQADKLNVF